MTSLPTFLRLTSAALALLGFALSLALGTAPARADGTVQITHISGDVDNYPGSKIDIIHNALYVTTSDGQGTLVINRAACAYQNKILVCLPTSATLVQSGSTKALDISVGTVYFNFTNDPHQLSGSSASLAPHSVMLSLNTRRGTYISMIGQIDKVTQ